MEITKRLVLTMTGMGLVVGSVFAVGSATQTSATTTVTVTEAEYSIQLSQTSFTPGKYLFVVKNEGNKPHALSISGKGVPTTTTGTVAPGSTGRMAVLLLDGTYELWDPVNKGMGMDTHIRVGPAR
ncbi:hypothetical protein [Actinoallomurus rhizosphaericola]|uniref:hypothetical protein n=1 Tax=Actinoallomurus rhizosphaericola TaxID=2952536 RepID=UPI0020934213|nr:hypothetical protein [Actinoallomurus rhizosphaericola]MCO5995758.1 hypothetical protein [Actinoallomurus rhizosphaericola]